MRETGAQGRYIDEEYRKISKYKRNEREEKSVFGLKLRVIENAKNNPIYRDAKTGDLLFRLSVIAFPYTIL